MKCFRHPDHIWATHKKEREDNLRTPAYSVLTMTGPNRLLEFISEIKIEIKADKFTVYVEEEMHKYGEWLAMLLQHYCMFPKTGGRILDQFERVVRFPIGDNYGAFPDNLGEDLPKGWEDYETELEDPALFKKMQNALDAVMQCNEAQGEKWAAAFRDVESFISAPKFGGPVFLCAGIVMIGDKFESDLIQVPHGTDIEKLKRKESFAKILISGRN